MAVATPAFHMSFRCLHTDAFTQHFRRKGEKKKTLRDGKEPNRLVFDSSDSERRPIGLLFIWTGVRRKHRSVQAAGSIIWLTSVQHEVALAGMCESLWQELTNPTVCL